ncbi:fungalysin metallopeptidase (M36) [Micromonospora pisi]|uniref:Fungalysin metallopeptidase (M36) n=1 Tax=Micromonospora pisi TaxID=589240 RepID=A0A495JSJ4_9ACTN|nr:M36 family metallopeptidase [Micromonospora pisi]RKR91039.1 fungalysin metallopeptidase (M36) [Micromonospora pisi]
MRKPERTVFGTRWRAMPAFVTAVVLAATLPGGTPATAAPETATPATPAAAKDAFDHGHQARDKDNRRGTAAPSSTQRSVAGKVDPSVRWNALGTPHALGPGTAALATGLATDPETAARQYLVAQRDLFGLDATAVAAMDKLLVRQIGTGAVVTLRQRLGDLPAGFDGLVSIAVDRGSVIHVSSSLTRDTSAPAPLTITADEAYAAALADAGLTADQVATHDLRKVAVPTPVDGNRAAWEVTLIGKSSEEPAAFTTFVDGTDRSVLIREDLVDYDSDNPQWAVFPANPPSRSHPRHDDRVIWCQKWERGCERTVQDAASGEAWDVDLATGLPTETTRGNSANNVVSWGAGTPAVPATPSPTRDYIYPFTDQWKQSGCSPEVFTSPERNDIDAATANLFAMHNRMHDWAYHLGFDEGAWNLQAVNLTGEGLGGDAEQGRAQQGALTGNRNNANQSTPRDGLPPSTNMYLWQPIAGTSYPPCVDGDYDMTVIGHEYTHAISNRMIAGPDAGIGGHQGGAMGESWSDLLGTEYLYQHNMRPAGKTPFIVGAFVTGNNESGIRNYDLSRSPLNYSDVGYALSGPAVHADGEIWGATNYRVRSAFVDRYGDGKDSIQLACAEGKLAVDRCPGNRRWSQLVFDSMLLQAVSQVSMLDMRDNMLAADQLRFGGRNQDIIWNAFAESGMGRDAATINSADTDPTPSFASPHARNATVTLRGKGDSAGAPIRLYVGEYEARAVPIADTDPATALPDTFEIVPGKEFSFLAVAPGFGHSRFTEKFHSGEREKFDLDLERNLASLTAGAVVSGDGVNLDRIADDTETTNWASLDGVAGKRVTVALPGAQTVRRVNVSAFLRPAITGDVDTGSQNALTALRSFTVLACDSRRADCADDANYRRVYTSRSDAFPGGAFRPYTRELNLRSFEIPKTTATHLRLEVAASQCTGGPLYAGEQDSDPATTTDCATGSPFRTQVRIAEFQAFER